MKRRLMLGAITVVLGACGSSAAHSVADSTGGGQTATGGSGGAAGAVACGPSHARTLAASSRARVYVSYGQVFGCAHGSSRSYLLGQSSRCLGAARVAPAAVTGVLAAYGSERCGVDSGSSTVTVRRLTDGAVLAQESASSANTGPESYPVVTALVLASDGDVSWISVSTSVIGSRHATQVHAFDRHGLRVLDHGNSVDPRKLRLHGSKVSWKHGASWRSATLD